MKQTALQDSTERPPGSAAAATDCTEPVAGSVTPEKPHRLWATIDKAARVFEAHEGALDLDDIPACPFCGAMAGACPDYPNCPNGAPDAQTAA